MGPHTIVAAGGTGAVGGRAPPCWPLCDVTGSRPCAGHLERPSSPFIKLLDNIVRGKTVLQVAERQWLCSAFFIKGSLYLVSLTGWK